jgi:hypothetical protein
MSTARVLTRFLRCAGKALEPHCHIRCQTWRCQRLPDAVGGHCSVPARRHVRQLTALAESWFGVQTMLISARQSRLGAQGRCCIADILTHGMSAAAQAAAAGAAEQPIAGGECGAAGLRGPAAPRRRAQVTTNDPPFAKGHESQRMYEIHMWFDVHSLLRCGPACCEVPRLQQLRKQLGPLDLVR